MQPLAFIGGAITGMAGLAAATFIDYKLTESKFSPELKTPEILDRNQVIRELNNYFFKQQTVLSECNRIVLESSDNIVTPMPLPWDNALQKAANAIGGGLLKICRKGNVGSLLKCQNKAEEIYTRYRGVFERADNLLADTGRASLPIPSRIFEGSGVKVNNAPENENWIDEFEMLADQIRDGIEHSCTIAEQLIEALEQEPAKPMLGMAGN